MNARVCLSVFSLLALSVSACAQAPIHPDEGRPVVQWNETRKVIGKTAFVVGKCINVSTAGRITFINFDDRRPARFAGVIFDDNIGKFKTPPRELYQGKNLRIRGMVSTFRGQPQIVITDPGQIEVIATLPPSSIPQTGKSRTKPGEVAVASYNLLNLFDEHDDPYHSDEGTPPKPREQLTRLAQSIYDLNADVVAVEEVENREYLERFVDVFLPDMGYDHVALIEGNDLRGIDCGLISRIPVSEVRTRRHLRFEGPEGTTRRFSRDVPAVTLLPPDGKPFEVWILHLKSNSDGREIAEPLRLAEAREIRRLLDETLEANPDARIIVTGDFNDTPETATIKTIAGDGAMALWSAHADLDGDIVPTYNVGQYRSMIDFIMCSPAMRKQYVDGSFSVPQGSIETTGSDHNPVRAVFRIN